MTDAQDIIFGVAGQSLVLDVPDGRPSSVTSVTVFEADNGDDSSSEAATTGSPAIESVEITTSAVCGFGQTDPRNVPTDTPNSLAVGRRYQLHGPLTGIVEWFEVVAVLPAAVTARHPLHNAHLSSTTIRSTRITQAVDATWAADETNVSPGSPNQRYRVRWVYVLAGATVVRDTYFDLVRYPGDYGVLPQDVDDMVPGWLDRLPVDHRVDQGRKLIANAYREVRTELHEVWKADEMIANAEIIDQLVKYKAIALGEFARYLAGGGDPDRLTTANQMFSTRFDALVRVTSKVPTRNAEGAAAVLPAVPFMVR